jgi:hypothetical protein
MSKQNLRQSQDDINPDLSQITLYQLLEQISNRDQKISWIHAERAATVRALKQTLLETQRRLTEREAQLHEILTSRTWKMALFLQRIRNFLVPLESRRARILQAGLDMITSPFKKIKRD